MAGSDAEAAREQVQHDSPGDDLMNMMKDLYDNGDDQMKKTLGEAMLKSRQKQAMGLPDDELNP